MEGRKEWKVFRWVLGDFYTGHKDEDGRAARAAVRAVMDRVPYDDMHVGVTAEGGDVGWVVEMRYSTTEEDFDPTGLEGLAERRSRYVEERVRSWKDFVRNMKAFGLKPVRDSLRRFEPVVFPPVTEGDDADQNRLALECDDEMAKLLNAARDLVLMEVGDMMEWKRAYTRLRGALVPWFPELDERSER